MRLKSFLIILLTFISCGFIFAQETNTPGEENTIQDSVKILVRSADLRSTDGRGYGMRSNKMDSKAEIFYSNAPMHIAPNGTNGEITTLYVLGTMKYGNEAEITQKGETLLTGDFVSMKEEGNLSGVLKKLFVDATETSGVIRFAGKRNKQEIARKNAGDMRLLDAAKNGLSFMDFPRIRVDKEAVPTIADRPADDLLGVKYDFETMGFVSANSNIAMRVNELDLVGGQRFSAEVMTQGLEIESEGIQGPIAAESYYNLNSAYVDVRKLKEAAGSHPGFNELNMKLYKYDPAVEWLGTGGIEPPTDVLLNKTNRFKLADGSFATFLRGITSPFEKLRTDYMFYHVLTVPGIVLGSDGIYRGSVSEGKGPESEPTVKITTGKGHFFAMDASSSHYKNIEENWHVIGSNAWNYRERGGYNMSRIVREFKFIDKKAAGEKVDNFNLFTSFPDGVSGDVELEYQKFNTGDVTVDLVGNYKGDADPSGGYSGGLNYLANPYMTPISLAKVLLKDGDAGNLPTAADWTSLSSNPNDINNILAVPYLVTPSRSVEGKVMAVHRLSNRAIELAKDENAALIRSKYWIVNTALVATTLNAGRPMYAYNVKYDNVDLGGTPSTVPPSEGEAKPLLKRHIEPMQLFMIQSATNGKFTFTNEMKMIDGERFPTSFKAGLAPRTTRRIDTYSAANDEVVLPDWLMIEAEANKNGTITTDRTSVRFYANATLGLDPVHDVVKAISYAPNEGTRSVRSDIESVETLAPSNVIYTVTPKKEPLLGNAVGYKTKEIPLYYIPGNSEEEVTFTAYGIDGFDKIYGVWLIDHHSKNMPPLRLYEGTEYKFVSKPSAENAQNANRFTLKFYDEDEQIPGLAETPITCYYSGSTLHIGGLIDKDMGSVVQIFDLQGRLMGNTVVNNTPGMAYNKVLGQGTFIVRITGERNFTSKFVNLRNY